MVSYVGRFAQADAGAEVSEDDGPDCGEPAEGVPACAVGFVGYAYDSVAAEEGGEDSARRLVLHSSRSKYQVRNECKS